MGTDRGRDGDMRRTGKLETEQLQEQFTDGAAQSDTVDLNHLLSFLYIE